MYLSEFEGRRKELTLCRDTSNIANFSDLARRREEEEESKRGGNQGYFSGHGTGCVYSQENLLSDPTRVFISVSIFFLYVDTLVPPLSFETTPLTRDVCR